MISIFYNSDVRAGRRVHSSQQPGGPEAAGTAAARLHAAPQISGRDCTLRGIQHRAIRWFLKPVPRLKYTIARLRFESWTGAPRGITHKVVQGAANCTVNAEQIEY